MENTTMLIERFIPLANKLAFEKKKKLPRHIEFEELQSAAYLGLVEAASRYDSTLGIAFTTFAWPRINGSINDYLRSLGFVRSISLDSNDQEVALKDTIEAHVTKNEFDGIFELLTKSLETQAETMLRLYYVDDLPMKKIGQQIGLTEGRVSQLFSSYKEQISSRWTKSKLMEELAA